MYDALVTGSRWRGEILGDLLIDADDQVAFVIPELILERHHRPTMRSRQRFDNFIGSR